MKGLLIKDWKLLKNQRSLFLIFTVFVLFFLYTDGLSSLMTVGYATLFGSISVISTISYDEYDNGDPFLFTLPFSRRDYVREKYLFALLASVIGWLFSTVLAAAREHIRYPESDISEFFFSALLVLAAFGVLLSVTLPLQLKFGGTKGTAAIFVAFFACAAIAYLAVKAIKIFFPGLLAQIMRFAADSPCAAAVSCLVFSAAVLLISMKISTVIIERKEF